jgi:hypothetical protein
MREGFQTEDTASRKLNATTLLASSQDMVDEYIRVNSNMGNAEDLTNQLTQTIAQLKGKIADSHDAIQTYEQEFMERKQATPVQPALKTLQDYVLVFFFVFSCVFLPFSFLCFSFVFFCSFLYVFCFIYIFFHFILMLIFF